MVKGIKSPMVNSSNALRPIEASSKEADDCTFRNE